MESGLKVLPPVPHNKPAWSSVAAPPPCSLATVMDEELARKIQHDEEVMVSQDEVPASLKLLSTAPPPPDTDSDLLLAQMLQLEFNREHDHMLNAEEKHYNKHNRVHVSFEKYRSLPPSYLHDNDDSPSPDDDEEDECVHVTKTTPHKALKGKRRSKGVPMGTVTKHDPEICGRRNVANMEKFPPDFPVGDMSDQSKDYRLPNSVFNTLRTHSYKEEKLAQRLHEKKEHSTQEQALDPKTRLLLFKLVNAGVLEEVNGCVSTGKEACVYHALGGKPEDRTVPEECAVKVFKTTLNEFKNRDAYIKDDYRFKGRFKKHSSRQVVQLWAEKEMHNLRRLAEGGVACPEVVLLKKHVLVMSFIGHNQVPAPTLKEAGLTQDQLTSAYQQCIKGMKKMYRKCHLIHADLSEYNMLWHEGAVIFIDVGQSVEPSHPHGLEFLFRDCTNVSKFFTGSVDHTHSPQELFNYVTGMGIQEETESAFLIQVRTHTKRESLMQSIHNKKDYPFDYFFEHTTAKATDDVGVVSDNSQTVGVVSDDSQTVGVVSDDSQTVGVASTDEQLCTEEQRMHRD